MVRSEKQSAHPADDEKIIRKAEHPMRHSAHYSSNGKASFVTELGALLEPDTPPDAFLPKLLRTQCVLCGAEGGVLMQVGGENRIHIVGVHPPLTKGGAFDAWVSRAAKDFAGRLASGGRLLVRPEPTSENTEKSNAGLKRARIIVPIQRKALTIAALAFIVPYSHARDLQACLDKLELIPFLMDFNDLRLTLEERRLALERISMAMDVLSALNRARRFMSAAMAVCNEMATRWQCRRVSIGFQKGRYVQIRAVSNTEKVNRKMRLLQDLEAVMEECLDQDVEVVYPADDTLTPVSREAGRFSNHHGPTALLSLPLRYHDDVCAVLTLERPVERPFSVQEIEVARLTGDLCAPRLMELSEQDQWIGARMAGSFGKSLESILQPRQTLAKLSAILLFLLAVFLIFIKGSYRVESPILFETTIQQAVVAPFDSYIKSVAVEPGDHVLAGETLLGELEISELRLELAALKAEQIGYQKQAVAAMRDQKTTDTQIALARQDKVAAQISLMEARIGQGTLVAPMTGRILSKDLKQRIGAPVETGTVLFEIAPLESLQAVLYVPEDAISDVTEGQEGTLVSVGHPSRKIPFVITRIHPMAEVVNQRNVFRVHAKLLAQHEWMRPGMEGMAKISVGKKSYLWIGSRRLVNWLRMKIWL